MEPISALKPNVSEEQAVEIGRRLYGLEVVRVKRMVSFEDQNFHIQVDKQHKNPYLSEVLEEGYTLKITCASKTAKEGHFGSMHTAMIHLNAKGLQVPLPICNLEGRTWTKEKVPLLNEDPDSPLPDLCGIHLLTFIPGVPVSTQPYTTDLLYRWGVLMARFHMATEDFVEANLLGKSIFWSLENIPEIRKYMVDLEDHRAKLIHSVLDRYPSEIGEYIDYFPKGFIHGDFNENNVLAQVSASEGAVGVAGILDLEDMHCGPYVWDVGVLLAYTLLDCETMDPLLGAGHALAGYLSLKPLNDLEMSALKMCIQCRLCQSLVLCAYSYRSDSSNSYLLSSARAGWTRLEQILGISNEDLLRKWTEVRQGYHHSIRT